MTRRGTANAGLAGLLLAALCLGVAAFLFHGESGGARGGLYIADMSSPTGR